MEYLLVVDYESDAERKRIDYAMERWGDRAEITKPKGTAMIFKGANIDEFLEDLYSRLEGDRRKVGVYRMEEYHPDVEEKTRRLHYESRVELEALERFLSYLMSKVNAGYGYRTGNTKKYIVATKKGQASIEITLKNNGNATVLITIQGYGEVVELLAETIDCEMEVFLGDD
jgi:hypothetical protein